MPDFYIYSSVFFESIGVFMFLFFLLQYSILRKKEYFLYALYLFTISAYYILALPEMFFTITVSNEKQVEFLSLFKRPAQFLTSVFYTLFIIHYLGLNSKSTYLFRFFKFLIWLYIFLSAACLLLNFLRVDYNKFYYLICLLLFPVQMYVVIALFKNKVPYARYIIWGTIILLVGSSVTLIMSIYINKALPITLIQNIKIFLPVQLSILLDMFLFTIALQRKIADNERSLIEAAYQRQQAILLERERIIADLHDDVGGGLSSIRMMSDLMVQQGSSGNPSSPISFPQKISATAKDIAQRMHTIIWSLNAENDTLNNFIEYVRQYGVSFFENAGITFRYNDGHDSLSGTQLSGVQRKNLFLVIKEAFHNILKHSKANAASIHISMTGNTLHIKIDDNGTGIDNQNRFGNGLKNMQKRVIEIGGDIDFSSSNGTTITIAVELNK